MPVYEFVAVDADGEKIDGRMTADSLYAIQQKLELIYTEVISIEEPSTTNGRSATFRLSPRVKAESLAICCRQLSVMVKAGIPINRAFRFCAQGEDPGLNIVMLRAANDIEEGLSVARALSQQPRVFGELLVGLVSAGEASGTLDKSLTKLSDLLEKNVTLQKKVQSAMSYPLIILVVSLAVAAFFTFYVLPQLVPLFVALGTELPLPTKILVWLTETLRNPVICTLLVLLALAAFFFCLRTYQSLQHRPRLRMQVDEQINKIPILGSLLFLASQSRVLYTMATMLDAGSSLTDTMVMAERVATNEVLKARVRSSRDDVIAGTSLDEALGKYECFEPIALAMINVGQETGTLAEMMGRVAQAHDEEVEHQLDTFTSLIEPIMMAGMGIFVGFVTVACFLPMVNMLRTL